MSVRITLKGVTKILMLTIAIISYNMKHNFLFNTIIESVKYR